MQVRSLPSHVIRAARSASRLLDAQAPNTEAARRRDAVRRWREAMRDGLTAEAAARAVNVSRASLYRWERQPEPLSRRPKCVRARQWSGDLVQAVEDLRNDNPVWGKRKLGPLLRRAGRAVSDSTVGRILAELIRRGRVLAVAAFQSPKPRRKAAKRA